MMVVCGRYSGARPLAQLAYTTLVVCVGGLLLFCLAKSGQEEEESLIQVTDALALGDELEKTAIYSIHSQLDDNADGTVDFSESEEFVQTELLEGSEKSQKLHETDSEISSEELWNAWHENEVFGWSSDDVIAWLESYVELPQYTEAFRKYNITGRHLPRIANNTNQILKSVLMISDNQHKQKIQLRAMDVVLFGPPNGGYSYWKDAIVVLSVTLCMFGILYALRQRHLAQSRIDTFLESIRGYDKELQELKERLEQQEEGLDGGDSPQEEVTSSSSEPTSPQTEEEMLSNMSLSSRSSSIQDNSLVRAQAEIEALREKVWSLETQWASFHVNQVALQGLLQQAYHREWEHLESRKRNAEDEMTKAQKVCDKIKRQRSSLIGTFRLANSSAVEEAGLQITKAVNKMHIISESFDEYHKRWREIEQVTGFTIIVTPSSPSSLKHHHNDRPDGIWGSRNSLTSTTESLGRQLSLPTHRHSLPITSLSQDDMDIVCSRLRVNSTPSLRHGTFHPCMSLPVFRTVESTGSLLEDSGGGGISFLDPEEKEKGRRSSDSKSYGRSNSNRSTFNLDAIKEEEGPHRRHMNGQVETLWEDSDQSTHSGSETGRRKKPKKGTKKLQLNS